MTEAVCHTIFCYFSDTVGIVFVYICLTQDDGHTLHFMVLSVQYCCLAR